MMSAISNYIRQYRYDTRQTQGSISDFSGILNDVHEQLSAEMNSYNLSHNAQKLQKYLQDIKNTVRFLREQKGENNVQKTDLIQKWREELKDEVFEEYHKIVMGMLDARTKARLEDGLEANDDLNFLRQTHYKDASKKIVTSHLKGTSTISEDDINYIYKGLEYALTNKISDKVYYTGTDATHLLKDKSVGEALVKDIKEGTIDWAQHILDENGQPLQSNLTDLLHYEQAGKIDISGENLKVIIKMAYHIKSDFLKDFANLMADATFTVKNYQMWNFAKKDFNADLELHLGKSNLLKPIVAVFDRLGYSSPSVDGPRDMFYRGMQTMMKTNGREGHPTAKKEEVALHYMHMRYLYELTGYGLLDKNNNYVFAKYLIYNDPNSNRIWVKDTPSLVAEALNNKSSLGDLFKEIKIKATSVES